MAPVPPPLPDLVPQKGLRLYNATEAEFVDSVRDILTGCSRYQGREEARPDVVSFQHVTPMLQQGPTCGLVAVAMISSTLARNWTVEDLLEDAQAFGFSRSGEMFSVENMATLVRHAIGDYLFVDTFSGGMRARKEMICHELLNAEALYLVPYDADKDHSPACLKGHKAHWAIICGGVICDGNFCVLARQGKSRHVGMWSFDDLDRSNANLEEICPRRLDMPEKYIFHDLRECMAGRYIRLIYKKF